MWANTNDRFIKRLCISLPWSYIKFLAYHSNRRSPSQPEIVLMGRSKPSHIGQISCMAHEVHKQWKNPVSISFPSPVTYIYDTIKIIRLLFLFLATSSINFYDNLKLAYVHVKWCAVNFRPLEILPSER